MRQENLVILSGLPTVLLELIIDNKQSPRVNAPGAISNRVTIFLIST